MPPGPLTIDALRAGVADGTIDTVVLAIVDIQGRLQGKRFDAEFFIDEVASHGTEGCNYLLAVDIEMNTVGGYTMSSWERGYGDFGQSLRNPSDTRSNGSRCRTTADGR